jgi:ZIP family zinc transporter
MWLYAFIPVLVAGLGALWTTVRSPGDKTVGAVQHFAAGVVFYAAAGEILPDVVHKGGAIWPVVLGGGLGIAAMLLLRHFTEGTKGPAGLIAVSGLDALIDGLVLGLGFNAGQQQGILLAIALAVEFLFLGLSIAGAFGKLAGRTKIVGAATGVSMAVPLGVLLARPIGGLPAAWQVVAFSFGLIALLYLVTEELLTEAHEKPETAWGAAMFFVGFLALTVIDLMMGS